MGRNGGAVCTSSNARAVAHVGHDPWPAHRRGPGRPRSSSSRTSTWGATRGYELGWGSGQTCGCGIPCSTIGGLSTTPMSRKPPCCCGRDIARYTSASGPSMSAAFRAEHPGVHVVVHPECAHEVAVTGRQGGSRRTSSSGPSTKRRPARSSAWPPRSTSSSVLDDEHPDNRTVVSLDPLVCPCSTMFRIDAAHLCWAFRATGGGRGREPDHRRRRHRRVGPSVALERMLAEINPHGDLTRALSRRCRVTRRPPGADGPFFERRAAPPGANRRTHRSRQGVSGSLSYSAHTRTTAVSASTAITSARHGEGLVGPVPLGCPRSNQLVEAFLHGLGPRGRRIDGVGGEEHRPAGRAGCARPPRSPRGSGSTWSRRTTAISPPCGSASRRCRPASWPWPAGWVPASARSWSPSPWRPASATARDGPGGDGRHGPGQGR